ncbi:MAG: phosphatidylserine decarboxylase [Bacteroidia bacterium]|nr:phosphatidylserine decarboxylase [Bacteroidia bacterium]
MMKKIFQLILLVLLFWNTAQSQSLSPPVERLLQLYQKNSSFRTTIDRMFENVQPLPAGATNPWEGKGIGDLVSFMNEWFYYLPNAHDGLDRIIEFSFLYYKNPDGQNFILNEPGLSWSLFFIEEKGKFMDSRESAKNLQEWFDDPSLDHTDFVLPKQGFQSFNEFFTRDLVPGARPVDKVNNNSVLVSPADGIINVIENDLQLDTPIPTKANRTLHLNTILDYSPFASNFIGGTAMAVFLMPDNYHHFHAPIGGTIVESKESVGHRLFGMPDILAMFNDGNPGYNQDYSVFEHFRHGYFIIDTEEYGHVAMIPIGLQTIGSVIFEEHVKNVSPDSEVKVYKGQKLGHFAYGGSTVLLLFEKDRIEALTIRQGQRIGQLKK